MVGLVVVLAACVPTGLPEAVLAAQMRHLCRDGDQALLTSASVVVAGPCVASQPLPVVQPWRPQ